MEYFNQAHYQLFTVIADCAKRQGAAAYLIGGVVRDLVRGAHQHDFDIDVVVEGDGTAVAREVHTLVQGNLQLFPTFLTAKISSLQGYEPITEIDIVTTRSEQYKVPGALPTVARGTLAEDLARRDFTINTLALKIEKILSYRESQQLLLEQVIDAFHGVSDLVLRKIKILHPKSFIDDPTRIFRGLRYVSRIKGGWDEDTKRYATQAIKNGALLTISTTRRWNEIKKILIESAPHEILKGYVDLGGLDAWCLWNRERTDEVLRAMTELSILSPSREGLFEHFLVALRIFVSSFDDPIEKERCIREAGFGKKCIKMIQQEDSISSVRDLTIEALIARWAMRETRTAAVVEEMQRRKITKC